MFTHPHAIPQKMTVDLNLCKVPNIFEQTRLSIELCRMTIGFHFFTLWHITHSTLPRPFTSRGASPGEESAHFTTGVRGACFHISLFSLESGLTQACTFKIFFICSYSKLDFELDLSLIYILFIIFAIL